jgi:outer membrane protein TolC
MNKIFAGLVILACFVTVPLVAQESLPLSLDEALNAALKNNNEIIMASLDEQRADAMFKQTNAVFLPQIKVSYTAMGTNNPLNAFGFKLQQQSIGASDFNPELLNNPSATQNFFTKAEWQQPILNMDMLYMRRAAHEQRAVYTFKSKRTQEYLAFEVRKAYAQLQLAQQAKKVLEEAKETINNIYKATNNRFEKGFLQKSDILNVQVQVSAAESRLAQAVSNVRNASDYISSLMGVNTGPVYIVDPLSDVLLNESSDALLPENRADFQALQSAITAQDQMIRSGKMSYMPKLNGFAEYLINDNDAFGFGSDSYLVGAQLSWTLFNGTATRNTNYQHRIERDKMAQQLTHQKEQAQLELNKTLRQEQDARVSLLQYDAAVEQAAEALRILQNRYQQGLTATNDVLQSQTLLSQQKLNRAQAVCTINTTRAYVEFLTSTSEQ